MTISSGIGRSTVIIQQQAACANSVVGSEARGTDVS